MGFFNRYAAKEIEITSQSALLLSALSMIYINNKDNDKDIDYLAQLDKGNKKDDDFKKAAKCFKKNTVEECIDLVARTLNEAGKKTVLVNLVDIAMSDGTFKGRKKELVDRYGEVFDLDDFDMENVIKVISIKNKKIDIL